MVSIVFAGTVVQIFAVTAKTNGIGSVQICDQNVLNCGVATDVDLYSSVQAGNHLVYTSPSLSSGTHSILLAWTGRKNGSSGGTPVNVDRIAINYGGVMTRGTHFIDNSAGSGCSDSNSGTSVSAPWCDFNNLNGQTFLAGAQVLLRRGDTFNQELGQLSGGGSASAASTIGAYGEGPRPIITRNSLASDRAIWVQNGDFWNVQDLEVEDAGMGIVFWYDTLGHQGLNFSNLYIHNIAGYYAVYLSPPADLPGLYASAAIYISGKPPEPTPDQWVVKDIAVTDFTATHVADAFDIAAIGGFLQTWASNTVQNVMINNANWYNNWGCPNFDNISNVTILGSSIQDNAATFGPKNNLGTTNIFWWIASHITVSGSMIGNVPFTGNTDQSGSDFEKADEYASYRGNWIGGNAGAGLEFLANGPNDNHVLSDNVFTANGPSGKPSDLGGGIIPSGIWSTGPSISGKAENNIYSGILFSGATAGWSVGVGNTRAAASDIYNAGLGYSTTQGTNQDGTGPWSYGYWDGSRDQFLSYDSASGWWGDASGHVTQLSMLPRSNASEWIKRTWLAPRAGTIVVRGWLMEQQRGGDGIRYGITDNGSWQSGYPASMAANDTIGVATDLTFTVATNDMVQFQVNAGSAGNNAGDLVSWNPTVAYTG